MMTGGRFLFQGFHLTKIIEQWRARKRETIQHPFLKEKISIGLIPYTQSMLFARVLRGDLDRYPPFMWR